MSQPMEGVQKPSPAKVAQGSQDKPESQACPRPVTSPATKTPPASQGAVGSPAAAVKSPAAKAATPEKVSDDVKQVKTEAKQPEQPGHEEVMKVKPHVIRDTYKGSGKLAGKVALITGGDSGIGRSVAVHFAREGAKGIAIMYLNEHEDVKETIDMLHAEGCASCVAIPGDISDPKVCEAGVQQALKELGSLDIVVNNAAVQHVRASITDVTERELDQVFGTNLFSHFYIIKAALPHLSRGACIINSTSITAYKGKPDLLSYSTSKGGQVALTRALAQQLSSKGIRVNAVAPGPVWTPLQPATFGEGAAEKFGESTPMNRGGQPAEMGPTYVHLASDITGSYMTGQVLHPNGGTPTGL